MALSKGDVEESVVSRCICARILGAVSVQLVGGERGGFWLGEALVREAGREEVELLGMGMMVEGTL